MALDLLKRAEKGTPLTIAEHDANFSAIETEVNGKAATAHTHSGTDITAGTLPFSALPDATGSAKLLGRGDGGAGDFQEIAIGSGLSMVGTTLSASGTGLPTDDTNALVQDPADNTRRTRIDTGAVATATTRAIIMGDRDVDLAVGGTFAELGHSHPLDALSDVVVTSVANNEVLAFDTASGNWINQTPLAAGLQEVLATAGTVTPRAAGNLNFTGGAEGQVLTVDASGNVAFADISSHEHELIDITDAGLLAAKNTVGNVDITNQAVTLDKIVDQAGFTAGQFTNPTVTVSQEGIITAITSGSASGGLATSLDSATAIAVDNALNGLHKVLTAGTAITLTLDAQASVGTRCAFTPGGAGAVTAAVEGGAGYWLPGDNISGTIRTTSFALKGYGYFEVIRNTGGSAAEWTFVGKSDHTQTLDGALTGNAKVISDVELKDIAESYTDAGNKSGAASFDYTSGGWQKCVATGNITSVAITNPPATGRVGALTLEIHQDGTGGRTIAWGSAFRFPGGTDFTLSTAANAIDIFSLITRDGGTVWYVFEGGKAFAA